MSAGAFIAAHKISLGVGGAALVAGVAYLRSRSTSSSSSASTPTASTYSSGQQTAASTGYDSTSSDVYNALQPQLEAVGDQLSSLRDLFSTASTTPVPVPAAAPPTAGLTLGDAPVQQTVIAQVAANAKAAGLNDFQTGHAIDAATLPVLGKYTPSQAGLYTPTGGVDPKGYYSVLTDPGTATTGSSTWSLKGNDYSSFLQTGKLPAWMTAQ